MDFGWGIARCDLRKFLVVPLIFSGEVSSQKESRHSMGNWPKLSP